MQHTQLSELSQLRTHSEIFNMKVSMRMFGRTENNNSKRKLLRGTQNHVLLEIHTIVVHISPPIFCILT